MEGYWYIICVDLCMGQALGLSCGPRAVNLPPPAMPASEPRGGQVHPLATAPPQGPQGVHVARQAWAKIKTDTITGSSPEDNRKRFLLFSLVGAQILICHDRPHIACCCACLIIYNYLNAWLSIIIFYYRQLLRFLLYVFYCYDIRDMFLYANRGFTGRAHRKRICETCFMPEAFVPEEWAGMAGFGIRNKLRLSYICIGF